MKPGRLNVGHVHLSRIENGEEKTSLEEGLPNAQIFTIKVVDERFADIIHLLTQEPHLRNIQFSKRRSWLCA